MTLYHTYTHTHTYSIVYWRNWVPTYPCLKWKLQLISQLCASMTKSSGNALILMWTEAYCCWCIWCFELWNEPLMYVLCKVHEDRNNMPVLSKRYNLHDECLAKDNLFIWIEVTFWFRNIPKCCGESTNSMNTYARHTMYYCTYAHLIPYGRN